MKMTTGDSNPDMGLLARAYAHTHTHTHTHTHKHTPVSYTHLTLPTTAEV